MGRPTKPEIRRHEQAMKYLEELPGIKNLDQKEELELFVLEHFDPAYSSAANVTKAGIFFTPIELAKDFRVEAQGHNTIIDLCAGIGHLSYWLQDWVKWEELELVCVEINPEFVEVGKILVPNATWICHDILDPQFPELFQKKKFSLAISNPPFGKNFSMKDTQHLKYRGSSFEFKAIEVASKISRNGAFIIPQNSSPIIHYPEPGRSPENFSAEYIKFNKETGIHVEANCGIDAKGHKWKGASPKVEIVTFDFTDKIEIKPPKTISVYGVQMTSLEDMYFSKYVRNNDIAMNTKTEQERKEIALQWLRSHQGKLSTKNSNPAQPTLFSL